MREESATCNEEKKRIVEDPIDVVAANELKGESHASLNSRNVVNDVTETSAAASDPNDTTTAINNDIIHISRDVVKDGLTMHKTKLREGMQEEKDRARGTLRYHTLPIASSVRVCDPSKHVDRYRSYMMYTIVVSFAGGKHDDADEEEEEEHQHHKLEQVRVFRRYSDFVWLKHTLESKYPGYIIPPLPEKAVLGRFQAEFVSSRMRGLQRFLIRVLGHSILRPDPLLRLFLRMEGTFTGEKAKTFLAASSPSSSSSSSASMTKTTAAAAAAAAAANNTGVRSPSSSSSISNSNISSSSSSSSSTGNSSTTAAAALGSLLSGFGSAMLKPFILRAKPASSHLRPKTSEDELCSRETHHCSELEHLFSSTFATSIELLERRKEEGKSWLALGRCLMGIAKSEKEDDKEEEEEENDDYKDQSSSSSSFSLGGLLAKVARCCDRMPVILAQTVDMSIENFAEPLKDYISLSSSMKKILLNRERALDTHQIALSIQSKKKASLNAIKAASTADKRSIEAATAALKNAQNNVDETQQELKEITRSALNEKNRFKVEKQKDIKHALRSFVQLQIKEAEATAQAWKSVLVTLEHEGKNIKNDII